MASASRVSRRLRVGACVLLCLGLMAGLQAAPSGAAQLRKALLKGETQAAWNALLVCLMESGLDVRKEIALYRKEDRMPMSNFNHAAGVIYIPAMCAKDQADEFWQRISSLWTASQVDFLAQLPTEKNRRHGANLWVVGMMARELTHFLDRRQPTHVISPGQYFWRGSRLSMAVLRHVLGEGKLRAAYARHVALLRAWQAQTHAVLALQWKPGDDPDSLALRHGISWRPDGAESGALLSAFQLSMDLYWLRADSAHTLREVLGSMGLGAKSALPAYTGIIGLDAGSSLPFPLEPSCRGNQGPQPYDTRVALEPDGKVLMVTVLDTKAADADPATGYKRLRFSRLGRDNDFVPVGDAPLDNWKAGGLASVADIVALPDQGAAVVLRKGPAAAPAWRLYKVDLRGMMAESAIDLDTWYQAPAGDTSGIAPTKLLAAPDGSLYLLKIMPAPDGGADFGLYRLARDGSRAESVQRFRAVVGPSWFWAVDYAVDARGRLWIADDARGRLLVADGGVVYQAAGSLRGNAIGPGAAAQLYNIGLLAWDAEGRLLVGDQWRSVLPNGQVQLAPVLRKVTLD
jgi:hypothetical protein